MPSSEKVLPLPTCASIRPVRYGPRKTVTTVVENAEFAQSYNIQPRISRLSLINGIALMPASASKTTCVTQHNSLSVSLTGRECRSNRVKSQFTSSYTGLTRSVYPIGQHLQRFVGLARIIRGHMYAKIVQAAHRHIWHLKRHRQRRLFAGIEHHRTDGGRGRSTTCRHFNIGRLLDDKRLITDVH